jgi:hypothetical protein
MTTPRPRPGTGPCPDCHDRVLYALLPSGDLVALSNGKDGPWAVRWDVTKTPRGRRVTDDYRASEGEHRFRPHSWSCRKFVRQIGSAPSARSRRPARTTERREASAR